MQKLIYKLAMYRSRKYFIDRYSMEWYKGFKEESDKRFREIMPQIPDIGNSIFSTNYIFAPSYIAWYLALKEKNISPTETDEIIWHMNENLIKSVPEFFMKIVGKSYLNGFRKKAPKHIRKQETTGVHPYDWEIRYRDVNDNCFEIDILSCGIKSLTEKFHAEGLLPGICRMDYMYANMMHNGFERTKTLGDGDDCCNCRYYIKGDCEWNPEKGFIDRK